MPGLDLQAAMHQLQIRYQAGETKTKTIPFGTNGGN